MNTIDKNIQADIESITKIPIVNNLLNVICETTGMGFAAIARVTEDRWVTCSVRDNIGFGLKSGDELEIKTTICDEIRQSAKAVIIDHVDLDPHFANHHTPAMYGFQSYISVPIVKKDGTFFGTLCAIDPKPHQLNTPQVANMFLLFTDLISYHLATVEELKIGETKFDEVSKNSRTLQLALEAGKLGSYEADLKSGTIKSTPQCKINFGLDPDEQLNFSELLDMILPEDQAIRENALQLAIKNKTTFAAVYRIRTKNGDIRWIQSSAIPVYDSDGEVVHLTGVTANITEQKVSELRIADAMKEIEQSRQKLNIIIEASDLGTWELNLLTTDFQYSDKYLSFLGYDKGTTVTHQQLSKHLHPDDVSVRQKAFENAYITGILFYQSRVIWNDNSFHWVELRGKVFYDDDGQPILMSGTIRDLTDEKNYRRQLEEREQKFRLLADSMPQQVWTSDPNGIMNYYNQSVYNYSGLSREDVCAKGWLEIVHPDDREENVKTWLDAIRSGNDFRFEHRFRRHDGEYRWQLSRAIAQHDADGNIQMWVGTSTDIQDQKAFTNELEKKVQERTHQLEENYAELEKMNKELQSFAYISSHDLQEPLRKIQTFATIIAGKEKDNLSAEGADYFRRMQVAAERMQNLINDLLAYSRTTSAEKKFDIVNLQTIVDEVKSDLSEELFEKHAVIETGKMCDIRVISFQFRQLLHNLITNALKFTKPGESPKIRIESECAKGASFKLHNLIPQEMYCHIRFSDAGIGFENEYNEKIFEVFQRLHAKAQYAGTGIGLAIVKKIVENHHGIITANGSKGEGAIFDIYLPERISPTST